MHRERGMRVVRISCGGCHGLCQVLVHLDGDGRLMRVTGDPERRAAGFECGIIRLGRA